MVFTPPAISLNVPLVAKVSASIVPEVTNGERSAVDVTIRYCTAVPAGCPGIVAWWSNLLPSQLPQQYLKGNEEVV